MTYTPLVAMTAAGMRGTSPSVDGKVISRAIEQQPEAGELIALADQLKK